MASILPNRFITIAPKDAEDAARLLAAFRHGRHEEPVAMMRGGRRGASGL